MKVQKYSFCPNSDLFFERGIIKIVQSFII